MRFSVTESESLLEKSNINDIEHMITLRTFTEFSYLNCFYNLLLKLFNENKIFYHKLTCKICLWSYLHEKHLKIEHSGSTTFDVNAIVTALSILSLV